MNVAAMFWPLPLNIKYSVHILYTVHMDTIRKQGKNEKQTFSPPFLIYMTGKLLLRLPEVSVFISILWANQ